MKPLLKVIPLYNNEKQLIKKATQQNREAQRQLFEKHSPKMLSVCRQYINDIQFAEEVMLGGFLKVFTHLESFKGEGSFEGWIRRIMVRECISFLRKQKKKELFTDEMEAFEESVNDIDSDIELEHIQRLIDDLPEGYRMVFVMYAVEGYKHQEIAEMLQISVNTSKTQLFKARKMLQKKVSRLNAVSNGTT